MAEKSEQLFEKAKQLFPGGVNSPVRAFGAVGGTPPFMDRGIGPFLFDVDQRRYVDYVLSYGPLVLGHAHPEVVAAINAAVARGTSFGAPNEPAVRLAELIQKWMPSMEMLRFVNSGTEATMTALRLARAYTGRNKIVKFEGCYHGHADFLLVQAGSGVATLGLPDSPGVTAANACDTLTAAYNDLAFVESLFEQSGDEIAAIIVEPVAGNMGLVAPRDGFLQGLQRVCQKHGALLIFDEVMTGFRVAPGGAQQHFGVIPDLTTLGKVIGGGLPVGAYGGRADIMQMVAPLGPMYQAGTLSGNPLAMVAGKATLQGLMTEGTWAQLEKAGDELDRGIRAAASRHGIPISLKRIGSMSGMYFSELPPANWTEVAQTEVGRFKKYFHTLLANGVFVAPSPFEASFLSTAHDSEAIEITLNAIDKALEATQPESKLV